MENVEQEKTVEELCRAVDLAAKTSKELWSFGIYGIDTRGVHLTAKTFAAKFGTTIGVERRLTGSYIRCSVRSADDVEFYALFNIPKGVSVIADDNPAEQPVQTVHLYSVEL